MPRIPVLAVLVCALLASACANGMLKKEYEYEEELYLALDGSATLYLNASAPALVALRGLDLDLDPRARVDRRRVRRLFSGPGLTVATPTLSRRDGRRFLHVRIDAERVEALASIAPLAWSTYTYERDKTVFDFRQKVRAPTGAPVGDVGWTGKELVAMRMHVPSRIEFHNSRGDIQRGNILTWEQPLTERLAAVPISVHVRMETESILARTLLLFGSTIVAAALMFAAVVWWIARRGRDPEMAESRL